MCGALGPGARHAVVEHIAAGLDAPMSVAHEAADALFLTDRKPRTWRHRRTKGLALPETPSPATVRPREWQQAATELDAMGLCVNPNRTLIHTSVSGVAPVYYAVEGEAVYFASRIDALVLGLGTERRADWRAWSAILTHASPFGERTPFAGVSRLRRKARSGGATASCGCARSPGPGRPCSRSSRSRRERRRWSKPWATRSRRSATARW